MSVGIDLGAITSSVGFWENGRIHVNSIPSHVTFTDTQCLVGSEAAENLRNSIFDFKRLLGCKFRDYTVQSNIGHWPFDVVGSKLSGKPLIQIDGRQFTPVEIASMVLEKLRENSGVSDSKAVVTVPFHFNRSQRNAVKKAATAAGFKVLRVIDDPTAAAIAYGLEKGNGKIIVIDVGATASLVSLLTVNKGKVKVVATRGNHVLGGREFDQCLVDYCVKEHLSQTNIYGDRVAMYRLAAACEQAKCELSVSEQLTIESLGIGLYVPITRTQFETLCHGLVHLILGLVKSVLSTSNTDKSQISAIVMTGGSSCIPIVQATVSEYFNGKELSNSIDPNIVVAHGATILAGNLG
ncbi:hypothetical protein H4S07_005796 [Coemansia furcata]|uniref:Uncharacterized protein n=1 Tax=Coemansia furcata TaxID=417177 RepID=A0ACC1KZ31_9FUNG|nr:hypothetical protein H4S07_005796 [Coemansia furcata]